jgi:hypothetical protein
MKILEAPKDHEAWSRELTCGHDDCGAKLLVGEGDLLRYEYWPLEHQPGMWSVKYVCPVCKGSNDVADDVPLFVKERITRTS